MAKHGKNPKTFGKTVKILSIILEKMSFLRKAYKFSKDYAMLKVKNSRRWQW